MRPDLFSNGGHPFITRQLCSFLAEKYSDRPLRVTGEMVRAALDDYLDLRADKDFNEIFERLSRDYPEERDVCLELARHEGLVPIDSLTEIRVWEGYAVIQQDNGGCTLLALRSQFADSRDMFVGRRVTFQVASSQGSTDE